MNNNEIQVDFNALPQLSVTTVKHAHLKGIATRTRFLSTFVNLQSGYISPILHIICVILTINFKINMKKIEKKI
jgi:hypothetical protein